MPQVMLAYRAASFFSRRYCPEISMGLYTSDEIIDGDFTDKSYSAENMQAEVTREISDNANSVEFKEDVDTTATEATEEQTGSTLPPFMQAE